MRLHPLLLATALVTFATPLVACDESDTFDYDDSWGDNDQIASGKTDGVLDEAPVLKLGERGAGYVEGKQLDVFAIDLKRGDEIKVVESITEGSLGPHFTLYYGGATKVSSTSYTASAKKLTKNYKLTASGRYYVVVKAYQERGKGRFSLAPSCTGGTCAGAPIPGDDLDLADQNGCIETARSCALADLESYNGAVGLARARTIFQTCLSDANTNDDLSCSSACDADEPKALCDDIISSLPFYADQSDDCRRTVEECMEACGDADEGDAEEFDHTTVAICWANGLNGSCDGFARATEECGGELERGSNERCHEECESTTGAWIDDLDTLCVEACDE